MIGPQLEDFTVNISVRRSNVLVNAEPSFVRSEVTRHMRERLTGFVADAKLTERKDEFHTEYRLTLIVCSPDEFYGLVQREAMRMARYMPHPP